MRFFKSVVALGAVVGAMGMASSAHAQFASFALNDPAKFLYRNGNGSNAVSLSLATIVGTTATNFTNATANFTYLVANGASGTVPTTLLANITLSAASTTNVLSTDTQLFQNVSIRFTNTNSLTSKNGTIYAAGTANLLTLNVATTTGVTGTLSNLGAGSTSAVLSGATPANVVGYSSDFLVFTGAPQSYVANVTGVVDLASGTAGVDRQGSTARDFYGNLSGSFSGTALEPTPAPPGVVSGLIGIAMGGAQFGMMKFRSRRRAKKVEVAA